MNLPEIDLEVARLKKLFAENEGLTRLTATIQTNDETLNAWAAKHEKRIQEAQTFTPYNHCMVFVEIGDRQMWIYIAGEVLEQQTTFKKKAPVGAGA